MRILLELKPLSTRDPHEVVGGILFSQLLTLYITPVIYAYLEALRRKIGGKLNADS